MLTLLIALMTPSTSAAEWVANPLSGKPNSFYVGNREPLLPSAFLKLPIMCIRPEGWVRRQLELQAEGFIGHLTDISKWLKKENNAWLARDGKGQNGWEEVPYWLKGFSDLGYLLDDQRILAEAKIWIDATIASQRENGYFGPESNLTAHEDRADVWPNMIMLEVLRSYYEYSSDERVLPMLSRYFKWFLTIPEKDLFPSYWEKHRGGDMMFVALWLYNRTGEPHLLEVCRKIHIAGADWTSRIANLHGVNFAQAFREPATYYLLSKDERHLKATPRNYEDIRRRFGQVPGGLWGADENSREGFSDPRQAAETCTMAELMLSCERLYFQTGNISWAEKCEDVAFNSLPASMTADLKALRYLTSPNMVTSDRQSKAPGLQNSGPMTCMDPNDHRCCQHNVSHAWPYFAEHLWAATRDNGLLAAFYASSTVTARVGEGGDQVTIKETTHYPFEETVRFEIKCAAPTTFPLLLGIPTWCNKPSVKINDELTPISGLRGQYLKLDREWRNGDKIELRLPMLIESRDWPQQSGSRSVHYGPLAFSLKIGEKYTRSGGSDAWPAFEISPTTPWNYGLAEGDFSGKLHRKPFPKDLQPFRADAAPLEITTSAQLIPEWQLDARGLPGLLQESPAFTTARTVEITLIPMGAARLRISQFPIASSSVAAKKWTPQPIGKKPIPAVSSYANGHDPVEALTDGFGPKNSNDDTIPRFTWWNHVGTSEWVELRFPSEVSLSEVSIYWFDDRRIGGRCRVPKTWSLQYTDSNGTLKSIDAKEAYGTKLDTYNRVSFTRIKTKTLRVSVELQSNMSGGILELTYK